MSESEPIDYAAPESEYEALEGARALAFTRQRWQWLNRFRMALFAVLTAVLISVLAQASAVVRVLLAGPPPPPLWFVPQPVPILLALLGAFVFLIGMCLFLLSRLVESVDEVRRGRRLAEAPVLELGERAKQAGEALVDGVMEGVRRMTEK